MTTIEREIKILRYIFTNEQSQMQWYMTIIPGPGEGDVEACWLHSKIKTNLGKRGEAWISLGRGNRIDSMGGAGVGRGSESITWGGAMWKLSAEKTYWNL